MGETSCLDLCCKKPMKRTMAEGNDITSFQWLSAGNLQKMALDQPMMSELAGERYPTWVTDSSGVEAICQYVKDIDWPDAISIARQILANAQKQNFQRVDGDWSEAQVTSDAERFNASPETTEAAKGLILEPIHAFNHGSGYTFHNGNHRAIVIGALHPQELVPVVIDEGRGR